MVWKWVKDNIIGDFALERRKYETKQSEIIEEDRRREAKESGKADTHMNGMNFNAIDVETANADRSTICQIGIVHVRDGQIRDRWVSLVDPEDWFDDWNVDIHGISEETVRGAPTLPELDDELRDRLGASVVVSHTSFDRVAIERAMEKYSLDQPQLTWLDSAKVVRRAWPDRYSSSGYGLASVAHDLGIVFRHHDALEDATAAAEIVIRASKETGLDITGWLQRTAEPITPKMGKRIEIGEANPHGHLFGEALVFTGSLDMTRKEATDLATQVGCKVQRNVTKRTTLLVVGLQDKSRLNGYTKSSKHRKAETLIQKGAGIQILSEKDFHAIVSDTNS